MSEELDPTGGGIDGTKIVTVMAGLTALVTVVLNWLRGRREGREKAEATMLERYKIMVADMGRSADVAKADAAKDEPKVDAPKVETKPEVPRDETPKAEAPKTDAPKAEAKPEAPKEEPKADAPKRAA